MATKPALLATSAEDALYELLTFLRNAQADGAKNPEGNTLITGMDLNQITGLFTATIQMNVTQSIDANGNLTINAVEDFID